MSQVKFILELIAWIVLHRINSIFTGIAGKFDLDAPLPLDYYRVNFFTGRRPCYATIFLYFQFLPYRDAQLLLFSKPIT